MKHNSITLQENGKGYTREVLFTKTEILTPTQEQGQIITIDYTLSHFDKEGNENTRLRVNGTLTAGNGKVDENGVPNEKGEQTAFDFWINYLTQNKISLPELFMQIVFFHEKKGTFDIL
jgi:hypothetical protein